MTVAACAYVLLINLATFGAFAADKRAMGWKILLFATVLGATLWIMGVGPAELRRAAWDVSRGGAEVISPNGSDGSDWGFNG